MVVNQGTVISNELVALLTNNPNTQTNGDPTQTIVSLSTTAVTLTSFTAMRQTHSVLVRWVTSAEINTWGFYLYRSADSARVHATRVTPTLILGQGRGQGGATYTWLDTDLELDTTYTYWLQELDVNGAVNEYGPAVADNQIAQVAFQQYLPISMR